MSGTFPNTLAGFNGSRGAYVPGNLLAGEADLITNRAEAKAGMHMARHTVIAQDADGNLVPYDPATRATGTLTFGSAGNATDTIVINGHTITQVASGATGAQINIGATATETATNLKNYLNQASVQALTGVYATSAAGVVTLVALVGGTAGNSITTTETGSSVTASGGTLSGGAATLTTTYGKAIGITVEPVGDADAAVDCPYYSGGVFNHEALVWPAAVSTLAARRAVFNGTNIEVASLL